MRLDGIRHQKVVWFIHYIDPIHPDCKTNNFLITINTLRVRSKYNGSC